MWSEYSFDSDVPNKIFGSVSVIDGYSVKVSEKNKNIFVSSGELEKKFEFDRKMNFSVTMVPNFVEDENQNDHSEDNGQYG